MAIISGAGSIGEVGGEIWTNYHFEVPVIVQTETASRYPFRMSSACVAINTARGYDPLTPERRKVQYLLDTETNRLAWLCPACAGCLISSLHFRKNHDNRANCPVNTAYYEFARQLKLQDSSTVVRTKPAADFLAGSLKMFQLWTSYSYEHAQAKNSKIQKEGQYAQVPDVCYCHTGNCRSRDIFLYA